MKTLRFVRWLLTLGITPALSGCNLDITFHGNFTIGDGKTSVLPSPKAPSGQEPMPAGQQPPLDEAQQARKADWWIAYNGELLGYYPAKLFKLLNKGACRARYYTEVARFKPASPTAWPKTEVGNGQFPEVAGLFNTAYVRNPKYYDDVNWAEIDAPENLIPAPQSNDACYKSMIVTWGTHRLVLMGGPGGKVPGCKGPLQ